MSLPAKVVDRLFERLAATYGAQWQSMWKAVPVNDLKTAWAHELAGFSGNLEALAWALEHLPEQAPNVIQFRNLARQAPAPQAPRLPAPPQDPQRIAAAMDAMRALVTPKAPERVRDGLEWAKRIMRRVGQGTPPSAVAVGMAREALTRSGHNPDNYLNAA